MTKSILDELNLGDDASTGDPVDAIRQVASERGINPDHLIGLAKLETRLGDASIKGGGADTRNLFNIKDISSAGTGIRAHDKAEGSNDRYRQYASYKESVEDLVGLLDRRYPGALNAETGQQFAESLKKGGYATDPNYVSKLTGVIGGARSANAPGKPESAATSEQWLASLTDEDFRGAGGFDQSRVMDRVNAPAAKETSMMESIGDSGVALGAGLLGGAKSLTDVFGADNRVSGFLDSAAKSVDSLTSEGRKIERQNRQAQIKDAEENGTALDEILANIGAFADAPIDVTLGAIGSSAPTLLSLLIPGANATVAGRLIASGVMGMTQGIGAAKGSIFEAVERKLIENDVDEDTARKVAAGAQAYDGENTGMIAANGGLGILAAITGADKSIAKFLSKKAGKDIAEKSADGLVKSMAKGVAKEAPMESAQGGFERVTSNVALQNAGFDTPTFQGAAGQATLEGLASSPLGAAGGLMDRTASATPLPVDPLTKSLDDQVAKGNSPLSRAAKSTLDPFTQRANEVKAAMQGGGLDALRKIGPQHVDAFLNAMQAAGDTRMPATARQEAIDTLNMGMQWMADGKTSDQPATGSPFSTELTVPPGVAPFDIPTQDALEQDPRTVDGQTTEINENQIGGPRALPGPPAEATPEQPASAGFFTPDSTSGSSSIPDTGIPVSAETVDSIDVLGADSRSPNQGVTDVTQAPVAEQTTSQGSETPAAPAASVTPRKQVTAPKVAALPESTDNPGTAQMRKRKAQFGTMAAAGFQAVERRPEGFFLVNTQTQEEMRLDNPGDAQVARAVVARSTPVAGTPINETWTAFHPESGTLNIPRAEMPQVKSEHRGAMANFLAARGIKGKQETIQAADLKPTQAEFSQAKVDQAKGFKGEDRAILVSSDGHVLDGHHQWLSKIQTQQPVKVLRLSAPIAELLKVIKDFPSAGMTKEAAPATLNPTTGAVNGTSNAARVAGSTGNAAGTAAPVAGTGDTEVAGGRAGVPGDELRNAQAQSTRARGRALRNPQADAAAALALSNREGRQIALADPANPLTQAVDSLLDIMAGLTGQRGIAVHDTDGRAFDGAAYQGQTFINVANPEMHVGQTIAHEFKHLTEQFPALKVLYDRMWDLIPQATRRQYFETYLKSEQRDRAGKITRTKGDFAKITPEQLDHLKDEMLADFMGQRFNDKAWLTQLAKQKPALFGNFVREWLEVLDTIIDALRGLMNSDTSRGIRAKDLDTQLKRYVTELQQMKRIASEVAIAWAEQNPGLAAKTGSGNIVYSEKLRQWAQDAKDGKPISRVMDVARSPSAPFRMAGMASGDRIIVRDTLLRHLTNRGRSVDPDLIARLPMMLAAPRVVMVNYESEDGVVSAVPADGFKRRFNALVGATDVNGNPYLVGLHKSEDAVEAVDIKTLFGKDNSLAYVLRAIQGGGFVWMPKKEIDRIKAVTSGAPIARAEVSFGARPGSAEQSIQRPMSGIVFSDESSVKMISGGDWAAAGVEIGVTDADVKAAQGAQYSARTDAEQEYKDVEAQHKGKPSWMRAPNGAATNLNERQWIQVRTPSFQKWFGPWEDFAAKGGVWNDDKGEVSKAVDSNGEPVVVYHGTDKGGFMSFNKPGGNRRGDLGIFTTSNESMARSYVRNGRADRIEAPTTPETKDDLINLGYKLELTDESEFYYVDPDGYEGDIHESEAEATQGVLDGFDDDAAKKSGVYAAFINIRNPNESNFEGATWDGRRDHQWIVEVSGEQQYDSDGRGYFDSKNEAAEAAESFVDTDEGEDPLDYVRGAEDNMETTDDVVREAIQFKSDGAIIRNVKDDGGGSGYNDEPSDVFVALDPSQLKSADFNTGEFGETDDIRYSERFPEKQRKDGSLEVKGDVDEIRASIPAEIQGRAIKGGIVFSRLDAPRVSSALAGDSNAYSRAGVVVDKNAMKGGKYIGAPEKFNTPQKLPTLRKILMDLTLEGERGRFWYERSSEEILRMVGGDVQEARKFVALLAIYSPQARVDTNSTFALRAWSQYKAGQPVSVKTGLMDGKAAKAMGDVEGFWRGEKTGNFFSNLLSMIDPATKGKQGATIDMWMMRAGQYSNDAPTKTQYAFMELETNRVAKELGWEPQQVQAAIWVAMKARMENAGVKKRTESISEKKGWIRYDFPLKNGKPQKTRVILDAQAHRDNWLKQSFAHDVTQDDTNQAKFDFADGVRRHIGQISFEARPGRTTGILPGIHAASYAQQTEFQQAVQAAFLEEDGSDRLAQMLGLLVDEGNILSPGIWQGEVSPSSQKLVAMAPTKSTDTKSTVDPSQASALNVYAAVAGLVARQEGVGWHRPFYATTKMAANGLDIDIGRPLTPAEALALTKAIDAWMMANGKGADWNNDLALISSPYGIRLVNFGGISNAELQTGMVTASESALPDFNYRVFASDGDMPTNNWKENPNGQGYIQRIGAEGRSDVLDWARAVLAPRVQRVFSEFSERYGWGNPGEISFSERSEQDLEYGLQRPRGDTGGGVGRRATEVGSVQKSERLKPLDGAPSVPGQHGPIPDLLDVAQRYAVANGIDLKRQDAYVDVDVERATRIMQAYEAMPHAPNDPRVKEAFANLIRQTTAQYQALADAGYKFWFIDFNAPGNEDYIATPWNAIRDLRATKSMGVFSTADGFGSGDAIRDNPMETTTTEFMWPSGSLDGPLKPVLANDLFRAVHDAFGHGLEGAGFRARGEENAWQAHVRLFTGSAIGAITSETRGQNSWVNFGPNGGANQTANGADTSFADQKTGLMPEWTWTEGRAGDVKLSQRTNTNGTGRPTQPDSTGGYRGEAQPGLQQGAAPPVARSADQQRGRTPPYRPVRIQGAIHYGKRPGLSYLSGSSSGTGIKGKEQERLKNSTDKRLKQRVYFYLPIDGGIPQPEPGLGGNVYRADLGDIYDMSLEMIGGTDDAFESAVLDAGYKGYFNKEQGTIVVLGQDVEVEYIGNISEHDVIQRRNERVIPATRTIIEGDEFSRKPTGTEMIELINPAKRAKIQETAPSFRVAAGFFRVKQVDSVAADKAIEEYSKTFRFGDPQFSARVVMMSDDRRRAGLQRLMACL